MTGEDTQPVPVITGGSSAIRRHALGGILQAWRAHKGLSVENAAAFASLGHMTWRRLEAGVEVRAKTYATLDETFHLRRGSVARALGDDDAMVQLAHDIGIDTAAVEQGCGARRWLLAFARKSMPEIEVADRDVSVAQETERVVKTDQAPLVVTVAQVARRLSGEPQTPATRAAVDALLQMVEEMGGTIRS